ncbi:orotate phosphoribosyltransferase [Anaplasma platys]|nr:orotate phosphoribosyltransferase [Anaplasma platys]
MHEFQVGSELETEILSTLLERGAILRGHFLLSSGLHSDTYIQCAKLHEVPAVCEKICGKLLDKVRDHYAYLLDADVVAAPAVGGICFGYEVARQLNVNFVFFERVEGSFALRRGHGVVPASRVLIVEDVITTGKSSLEVYNAIRGIGGEVVGEVSIIRRSHNAQLPFPVVSLLSLDIKNYPENEVPASLAQIPVTEPGSRFFSKPWDKRA